MTSETRAARPAQSNAAGLPAAYLLPAMALGLALFYRGAALPLAQLPQLLGLALFGALALLRPDLGLLFVPLTAPLYLIPAAVPGLRAEPLRLPLHEIALLTVAGATAARWTIDRMGRGRDRPLTAPRPGLAQLAPILLLLLTGVFGVLIAVSEGRGAALRELRWLIVEPLLFYGLLRYQLGRSAAAPSSSLAGRLAGGYHLRLAVSLATGGALVAAFGLLQFVGLDLVPLLGEKQNFGGANVVEVDGLLRVTSVYGHPNNLGLFLGRVWPVAAALALAGWRGGRHGTGGGWMFGVAALLALAGILVSFSRGAWLGAVAAAATLGAGLLWQRDGGVSPSQRARSGRLLPLALAAAGVLAGVSALALTLRGGLGGGSVDVRVLLWREALELIRLRPLGLGLDQFYYYHNPEFGRSLMDPSLAGTSEQFASHPHNLALDAWLNLGPLGLAALGWLVVRGLRAGIGALGRDTLALGVVAAMVAALVHGLVDVFYFAEDLAIVFWLLLALAEDARRRTAGSGQPPDTAAAG